MFVTIFERCCDCESHQFDRDARQSHAGSCSPDPDPVLREAALVADECVRSVARTGCQMPVQLQLRHGARTPYPCGAAHHCVAFSFCAMSIGADRPHFLGAAAAGVDEEAAAEAAEAVT